MNDRMTSSERKQFVASMQRKRKSRQLWQKAVEAAAKKEGK